MEKRLLLNYGTSVEDRLFDAGIGRTDRSALRFVEVILAFDAFILVNDVIFITLGNGLDRANGFAGSTIDARIDDMQGHLFLLERHIVFRNRINVNSGGTETSSLQKVRSGNDREILPVQP